MLLGYPLMLLLEIHLLVEVLGPQFLHVCLFYLSPLQHELRTKREIIETVLRRPAVETHVFFEN